MQHRLSGHQLLSVLGLNVQRISNLDKFHNVLTFICSMSTKPDVLVLTETWILKGTESLYQFPGYKSIHSCRETSSAGVALYYKSDLYCDLIEKANDEVSYLHVKLYNQCDPDTNLRLTALYMPDSSNFPLLNERLNHLLSTNEADHLLIGDFNINVLLSNSMVTSYLDTIETFGFSIKNTLPTRPASGTLIDHIITNFGDTTCITLANDLSDHHGTMVLCGNLFSAPPPNGYHVISRTRTNFEGVRKDMGAVNLDGMHAKSAFTCFHQSLTNSINNNTVTTVLKVKKNNPHADAWINEELIKLSKCKHRLLSKRNRGVVSGTLPSRLEKVTRRTAELKELLREKDKKSKFGHDVCPRSKWNNINKLLGKDKPSNSIPHIKGRNGTNVTDAKGIAETFNEYFVNHATATMRRQGDLDPLELMNHTPLSIFLDPTTPLEVSATIKRLKPKKSVGWDCVSTFLLKNCDQVLSPLISKLFNLCIAEGYFPEELKKSRVVPVYKKGDRSDPNNYRPISILSTLNKIFELLLYSRLLGHLKRTNFLYGRQYGFRARSSTVNCAIDLVEYIYSQMDVSNVVTGVFLDLSKAFDMVNHDLLLAKLERCGVRGLPNDLFSSYLTGRSQYVSIKNAVSSSAEVTRGVPQGSVLGPLLFLIYINDISNLPLKGKSYLFADDSTIAYSSPSFVLNSEMAEYDLNLLRRFFTANFLALNPGKTKVMHFCTQRHSTVNSNDAVIKLDDVNIETVTTFKYLGLMLDSHLTWNSHVEYVASKIKSIVGILYRAKHIIPRDVRQLIYLSMFQPHLHYMVELWGSVSMLYLKRIQVIQNQAIRNVLSLPYLSPRMSLYSNSSLRILPVKAIFENALAVFIFKKINGLTHGELTLQVHEHPYNSRNRLLLKKQKCRLSMCQRSISFMGPSIFNDLPPTCKASTNITLFKRACFTYFSENLSKYLYY